MALEHALLVALSERPGSGLELAGRFERSIGFFWHATHQQIYRVLRRMETDGWLSVETVPQAGKPGQQVYTVSDTGRAGARRLAGRAAPDGVLPQRPRGEAPRCVVRRTRGILLRRVRETVADHETRLAHYRDLEARDYPVPADLAGPDLDQYLVLRGGIRLEEFWIGWLNEYLEAHA